MKMSSPVTEREETVVKADRGYTAEGLAAKLADRFKGHGPPPGFFEAARKYPALATDHVLDLIKDPTFRDPVYRQVVPSKEEFGEDGEEDPAGETQFVAVPGLLHRYPDRALIITTNRCLVRCRHCMRKRLWANDRQEDTNAEMSAWLDYLGSHPEIKEVILSGGDPLALPEGRILQILEALAGLPGERKMRVHSRALMACPSRITEDLTRTMAACGVKRFVTQMNHPVEVTEAAKQAARLLAEAGIDVENQAVLLKGVNDSPKTLAGLFKKTAAAGVRPYYLHHPDRAKGCMHFYLSLEQGASIFGAAQRLYKTNAPAYVADLPGASSKQEVLSLLK